MFLARVKLSRFSIPDFFCHSFSMLFVSVSFGSPLSTSPRRLDVSGSQRTAFDERGTNIFRDAHHTDLFPSGGVLMSFHLSPATSGAVSPVKTESMYACFTCGRDMTGHWVSISNLISSTDKCSFSGRSRVIRSWIFTKKRGFRRISPFSTARFNAALKR